jgi:hypothetical protein
MRSHYVCRFHIYKDIAAAIRKGIFGSADSIRASTLRHHESHIPSLILRALFRSSISCPISSRFISRVSLDVESYLSSLIRINFFAPSVLDWHLESNTTWKPRLQPLQNPLTPSEEYVSTGEFSQHPLPSPSPMNVNSFVSRKVSRHRHLGRGSRLRFRVVPLLFQRSFPSDLIRFLHP